MCCERVCVWRHRQPPIGAARSCCLPSPAPVLQLNPLGSSAAGWRQWALPASASSPQAGLPTALSPRGRGSL
eukprot:15039910-Alexandrium_andersonii.AAC.1